MTHATHIASSEERLRTRGEKGPIIAAVGATGGDAVLHMTQAVAARHSTDAVVVSVVAPPPAYSMDFSQPMLNTWPIEERTSERLQTVHNRLHQLGNWFPWREEPDVAVTYGDASSSIADVAHERDATLIVVGSGPHAHHTLFAEETALATVRKAHCPVLIVNPAATGLPKTVVIATDFSPASVYAATQAITVIADGATVHLVHVWNRIRTPYPLATLQNLDDAYERSLPDRFQRLRSALGGAHRFLFETIVREGPAAETVLAVARAVSADLIVVGRRGIGGLERLVIGSVSTSLVRAAPCSVLIVPDGNPVETMRLQRHMTGTSTVSAPKEWAGELEDFARRNRNRRTALEVDDQSIGAQVQESGYLLAGATYDPHDRLIELMFERAAGSGDHLTRSIGHVRNVATTCNAADVDGALCIETEHGSALLTFLEDRQEVT